MIGGKNKPGKDRVKLANLMYHTLRFAQPEVKDIDIVRVLGDL